MSDGGVRPRAWAPTSLENVMHDEARRRAEIEELRLRALVEFRREAADPRFERLVPPEVEVVRVAAGLLNAEGPVWMGDSLLFTDSPNNRILRWRSRPEGYEVTTFRYPSGYPLDKPLTFGQPGANGMTLDPGGRLVACEHGNRRVTRTEADGSITVLADRYRGKLLNRPNDVNCRSDGSVYFTDPALRLPTPTEPRELDFQGVFRVNPAGEVECVADDFEFPNGLAFSPDERTLYVDDSRRKHIRAFDVAADGSLANGRVFAECQTDDPGVPDGMKLDREGNLYCGAGGGIWVFDPAGAFLGRLVLPEWPRNLAWGDDDWRTLYVTAGTSLYRCRPLGVPGIPLAAPAVR
jgi:gluconolactonase